ncbi:MAG: hypothetical protein JNM75_03790 [Rhodospirillales bacterium]|nr:hypothetical protein [Rhodospirillales bacterium]
MGTYTGTDLRNTITPDAVSGGVTRLPDLSKPSAAADTINGLGGNDDLDGGGGGDRINGGVGNDNIWDHSRGVGEMNAGNAIHGGAGNDDITIEISDSGGANPADNAAYGEGGNDNITVYYSLAPNEYDDWKGKDPTGTILLHGGAGNDFLYITTGYDTWSLDLSKTTANLYGDAGDDYLVASGRNPNGDASMWAGHNTDNLYGGTGNDTYVVLESKDHVFEKPGEGIDTVIADQTDYTLPANVEKLEMTLDLSGPSEFGWHGVGNALDNVITGTELDGERLDGGAGDDTIYGKSTDSFYFGNDTDNIHGGAGNDTIYGAGGDKDTWDGNDRLYGEDGNDRLFGSFGDDLMYGGAGDDELGGQAGNDTLHGGIGADKLGGGTGSDDLYGDAGDDLLAGREGADRLSGGEGKDTFDYYAATDSGKGAAHDVILDFEGTHVHGGDRIDLAKIDADATKGGNQAFTFVGTTTVLKAGELHVVAGGGGASLVQGEIDGKAGADFEILVQDDVAKPGDWVSGDFVL